MRGRRADGALPAFRGDTAGNLRELAILTVGRHWKAEFEWFAHAPIAIREGLAEEIVEAIRVGTPPNFTNDDEAAVHGFVRSLLETGRCDDDVYADMRTRFGEDGIVELTGIVGHYTGVAMTLNSFEIVPPDGERPEFP